MLDTLIRGAKIVDGTGKAAFTADVGILDGMIEAVGNLSGAQAFETIEAAGRVLTPGFIDMHRHADAALFREGFGEAELCQGLTTLVNGNCGMSLAPLSGVISDATYPSGGRVHPRVYGTSARLIEKYVVQERVLTLEQAVHKVTGHAADRFGFEKKGVIAAGMDADLLLFSPENVREHGTYARPNLPATGFDEVFVLGERVIENGVYRGGSSGEMLGARMGY